MEEELNEHDLEGRLYAMLHHVDETQINIKETTQAQNELAHLLENGPRSTVRRYWRTEPENNQYQKINTHTSGSTTKINNARNVITTKTSNNKDTSSKTNTSKEVNTVKVNNQEVIPTTLNNNKLASTNTKPKEEKDLLDDLAILQSHNTKNLKSTIEFIDHDVTTKVVLDSSDEDEVVEVALPPKPTITIESSDEEELQIITDAPAILSKSDSNSNNGERAISASPVPSVVSSVSDEFIRGDCIALNISSRQLDKPSFDFSLHGSDLLIQDTPTKKKKKKKSKEAVTSTPIVATTVKPSNGDECFATPRSKAKKLKKAKYRDTDKSIPNVDIYDSDSNQSIISKKNINYIVTEKSLPSVDVYESDSNNSEITKDTEPNKNHVDSTSPLSSPINLDSTLETLQKKNDTTFVDLTENDVFIPDNTTDNISESIVMGNVTGFIEPSIDGDRNQTPNDISRYVSSKEPSILNDDLDFDNLKGKAKVCQKRRYSLTTLRAEMEKFYNESWGGEDFNHREIQKNMSRDKSLWAIDPKDRMPSMGQRKARCNYCNRFGHRDDTCRMKPQVCHICGNMGHIEPRCPSKICFNCGSPNYNYTNICRNCSSWNKIICNECGQFGHPSSHCPDLWRRYHNTIDPNTPLEKCTQHKKYYQLYCSGCSRKGHLIHNCRCTIPFSGLPINSPFVFTYQPLYAPVYDNRQYTKSNSQDSLIISETTPQRIDRNKRQSKSPTTHETHLNKKRTMSAGENDFRGFTKSPVNNAPKNPTKDNVEDNKNKKALVINKNSEEPVNEVTTSEKAPDYIPLGSSNHDKKGQIIQDSEVSDTSDVITSSRIYIPNDLIEKLKTKEGEDWLATTTKKFNVTVQNTDVNSFLNIKGKLGDQEAFQLELREWNQSSSKHETSKPKTQTTEENNTMTWNIPKNRTNLLRTLNNALNSLQDNVGDPKSIYKELTYSQGVHQKLLNKKVINPKVLTNSRTNIDLMLKKLNIVLLGQAGLGDGTQHLSELRSLKNQIAHCRDKNVSESIRQEIGEHYHSIFGSVPRDDYLELLKKYYLEKSENKQKRTKKKIFNTKFKVNNINNSIPSQQTNININHKSNASQVDNGNNNEFIQANNINNKAFLPFDARDKEKQLNKLMFYHRKLKKAQTRGAIQRKAKVDLIRKLHTLIQSLFRKETLSSKIRKKARKTQEEAQQFFKIVK